MRYVPTYCPPVDDHDGVRAWVEDEHVRIASAMADDSLTTVDLGSEVSGTLPVANGGTGDTGSAWTQTTPTVTPSAGAFGSYTCTVREKKIGKTVFLAVKINVTADNTASGTLSLPIPTAALNPQAGAFMNATNFETGMALISGSTVTLAGVGFSVNPCVYLANFVYEST